MGSSLHFHEIDDSLVKFGMESGTATATISLDNVPATDEIPSENWYFLYVTFKNSVGDFIDLGIWPINIIDPTNTYFNEENNSLKIFPNPANSVLHIFNENIIGNYSVEIISAAGKIIDVNKIELNGSNIKLDISGLPKGFYMVKLVSEKVYSAAFVKQ